MTIVDANVLVYAVNTSSAEHHVAMTWLDDALSGSETVAFPWITVLAFLRITTAASIFPSPLTVPDAHAHLASWLAQPPATIVEPGHEHLATVTRLLLAAGTAGNLTSDAHLAAIAIEHDAEVISFDRDFGRFPDVRWRAP